MNSEKENKAEGEKKLSASRNERKLKKGENKRKTGSSGMDSLDKARSLPDAWEAYLYGDPEDALEAYELNRDLPMTELLYYYTCAENPELTDDPDQISIDLTDALRSHRGDEVWYFGYLDILSKKDGLTEDEKRERNRVIMELAAGNRFNCPAVLPSELAGPERDKITDNFGGFDIIADRYDDTIAVWKILVQYAEKNGIVIEGLKKPVNDISEHEIEEDY